MEHQEKIDLINSLVKNYKLEGDLEAGEKVILMFKPFLLKNCEKYNKLFPNVHPWTSIEQESMIIFHQLMNEYTIGGTAYFNVFIMKKLPFRLRYFFIKEIKHRMKNLCHGEEQFAQYNLQDNTMPCEVMIDNMEDEEHLEMIHGLINSDLLNDREREMLMLNMDGMNHDKIADKYGISRSRVTKIIGNVLKKIRKEIGDYNEFNGRE